MKSRFLVIILLLFLTVGLSAQVSTTSIQNDSSFGVFTNEIDASINAAETGSGVGFTDLVRTYILGGLLNLDKTADISTSGVPIELGFFTPWPMSMSAYLRLSHADAPQKMDTTTQSTYGAAVTVTDGTTSEDHNWVSQNLATDYSTRLSPNISDLIQYLINVGPVTTGLLLNFSLTDSSDTENSYTRTTTNYYDSNYVVNNDVDPANNVIPASTVDYSITNTASTKGNSNYLGFTIPVFFPMASMTHFATLGVGFLCSDSSATSSTLYSGAPADPAAAPGSYMDTEANNSIDTALTFMAGVNYRFALLGKMVGERQEEIFANLGVNLGVNSGEESGVMTTQVTTYDAAGANPAASTRNDDSMTFTKAGVGSFGVSAGGGKSFYFALAPGIEFGFVPELYIDYSTGPASGSNLLYSGSAYVDQQDSDSDGIFDFETADTKITDTYTYTNTTAVNGAGVPVSGLVKEDTFTTTITLPTSIKIQPKEWKFAFTLGAEPSISWENRRETTTAPQYSLTSTTLAAGTTTTTNSSGGAPSETVDYANDWTINIAHDIGLQVIFTDDLKLDVSLNGNNIIDFEGMTLQLIAAIPWFTKK